MNEFEEKINNCLKVVRNLIQLFVRCRVNHYWPESYTKVADALQNLDSDLAIQLEHKIPKGGMGGSKVLL